MSSIIEGYDYDIFVSYRQKDNKGDKWVSEFVEALKTELESTFKDEISVYFDINPHDGLLETHDVDASLKDKLNCLVFMPIISRIYCDPKSFAWKHEFIVFVEQASKDQFGLKVKLPNGNVASRVLLVRIHDLGSSDTKLCESVLGGVLRGIEFIYKEPGVNRPLRSEEDNPSNNLNKTFYRNQINKVAIAVKEIISGLRKEPMEFEGEPREVVSTIEKPPVLEKSIIVLPFENISPDPDQEYFSDGLTEEIITDLSHIHDLLVISRSSAMTFKGTKKTVPEIARSVNVRYVLEGSIRKAGNNLRITAQLIEAKTDVHLWAEKFSGTLDDVFDIQEKVSYSIVEALKLRLIPEETKRLVIQPTRSLKAFELCLRSHHYRDMFTLIGLKKAIEYLEQALVEDPTYSLAYGEIAICYWGLGNMGYESPNDIYPQIKKYALKALELDESLAEAHMVLGFYSQDYEWDWMNAEKEHLRAIKLKPNDSFIHMAYSWYLALVSRHEESIREMKKALELDPLSVAPAACIGEVLMLARKSDLAIEQCKNVIAKEPSYWVPYSFMGIAYLQKGQNLEAVEVFNKGAMLAEGDTVAIALLGNCLGTVGRINEARDILTELKSRRGKGYLSPFWLSMVHLGLGEQDQALDWLEKGYQERAGYMWIIHKYCQFDPLQNNIIFQELCNKMNLKL